MVLITSLDVKSRMQEGDCFHPDLSSFGFLFFFAAQHNVTQGHHLEASTTQTNNTTQHKKTCAEYNSSSQLRLLDANEMEGT